MSDHHDWFKLLDLASLGVVLGTLAGALPAIAALFTIVWTVIRIYETATVQGWIARWKGE